MRLNSLLKAVPIAALVLLSIVFAISVLLGIKLSMPVEILLAASATIVACCIIWFPEEGDFKS